MNYSLTLTFKTSTAEKSSITIEKVKPDITKEEITALMDEIISKNIFESSKGADLTEKESAIISEKKQTPFNF